MKKLIFILIPLLCFSAYSQELRQKRSCRVIFVNKPANAPDIAHIFDGQEFHEIILSSLTLSRVVTLPPGDLIVRFTPNAIKEGEIFPPGAPAVKIPERYSNVYLLLYHDPENKLLPFKIKLVGLDGYKMEKGKTLWINTTKYQIAGKTGDKTFVLPASSMKVSEAPLKGHGFYLAQFGYRIDPEGQWLPIMKKNWWFDASSTHLGFVMDTGAKMPRIYTIRDRRPPKPVEPVEEGAQP